MAEPSTASKAAPILRTRKDALSRRQRWPAVVLAVAAFLYGCLLLTYGIWLQPPTGDPFVAERSWGERLLYPQPPPELAELDVRPLAYPGTGWAPRLLSGQTGWWRSGALELRPVNRPPSLALWGDRSAALIGGDGVAYLSDRPPAELGGLPLDWDAAASEPVVLRGHEGLVYSASFSPDGSRIVTTSGDGTARVWRADGTGEPVVLRGHEGRVISASFSLDGSRIVTASNDGTARVWRADGTGEPVVLHGHEDWVRSASFSPDGSRIVTASDDGTVRVWELDGTPAAAPFMGHGGKVGSVAFNPQGDRIVSASEDGKVRVWELDGTPAAESVEGHQGPVFDAAFSPDGSRIVTGSWDGTARVRRADGTGEPVVLRGHEGNVSSASFSPDGSRIVTASYDGTARVWRTEFPPLATLLPDGELCFVEMAVAWRCLDGSTPRSVLDGLLAHPAAGSAAVHKSDAEPLGPADQDAPFVAAEVVSLPELPELPENARFQGLAFRDADTLFVVGRPGLILASDNAQDAPAAFELVRQRPGETLTGIHFDLDGGWIAGVRDNPKAAFIQQLERVLSFWLHNSAPPREAFVLQADDALAGPWRELHHRPAPWVFVLGPLLFLLAAFVGVQTVRGALVEREGVSGVPSSDRPIGAGDRDALGLKPIARALSRFLRNTDTQPPLTIAVTGGWGTGKSSLMNLLQDDLAGFGARPVWFNAWHHHEEAHLFAALLENIRAQAIPPFYTWSAITFRLRLLWLRLRGTFLRLALLSVLVVLFAIVANWALDGRLDDALRSLWHGKVSEAPAPGDDSSSAGEGEQSSGAVVGWLEWLGDRLQPIGLQPETGLWGLVVLFLGLFLRGKLKALPVDPARLLSGMRAKASLAEFRDQLSFRYRFAQAFDDVCRAQRTDRQPGLVIIIDDLDRCPPEVVLQLLEAVNYLVSAGPCFIVLGMDRAQIEYSVGLGFKELVEGLPDAEVLADHQIDGDADPLARQALKQRAYATRYLEKLINIEVPVPALSTDAAVGMLLAEEPKPDDQPRWRPGFKKVAGQFLELARVAVIVGVLGLLAALLLEPFAERPVTTRDVQHGFEDPGAPRPTGRSQAPAVAETSSPVEDETQPLSPFLLERGEWKAPEELLPRWTWEAFAGLLTALGILFLLVEQARRRNEIERDSPEFAATLKAVLPSVHHANPTPRAIKLFENRMRYLATRLDAEANPHPPDFLDRLVRRWLPKDWFEFKPPVLDETKLLILGSEEAAGTLTDPDLSDQAAEISERDRQKYAEITGLPDRPAFSRTAGQGDLF